MTDHCHPDYHAVGVHAPGNEPRRFVVGQQAVMVAGVEGTVDAIDAETVTINGLTLPRRLDAERGIKYLSMTWPPEPCTSADHDRVADLERRVAELRAEGHESAQRQGRISDAIDREHDQNHAPGALRFCTHQICREVSR